MLIKGQLVKARQYIETHSKPVPGKKYDYYPCITISRETGAGSEIVSAKLLDYLKRHNTPEAPEWTIFDKNLISKVLEDYHLPLYLEKFLEEEKHSAVTSIFTELLTGEPSAWSLISKEIQTIFQLARTGNVIVIGRGGNFITAKLKNSFHVRLIAPIEQRILHVMELYNLGRKEAESFIKKDEAAKENFIFANFRQKPDQLVHYHIVLNTGLVLHDECAKIIGRAVLKRFKKAKPQVYNL